MSQQNRIGMPLYFFHIYDHGELIVADPHGLELPELESAREECSAFIQEVLKEEQWRDGLKDRREFRVVDQLGQTVLAVPFRSVTRSGDFGAANGSPV